VVPAVVGGAVGDNASANIFLQIDTYSRLLGVKRHEFYGVLLQAHVLSIVQYKVHILRAGCMPRSFTV
jgi:hypothetical protein